MTGLCLSSLIENIMKTCTPDLKIVLTHSNPAYPGQFVYCVTTLSSPTEASFVVKGMSAKWWDQYRLHENKAWGNQEFMRKVNQVLVLHGYKAIRIPKGSYRGWVVWEKLSHHEQLEFMIHNQKH